MDISTIAYILLAIIIGFWLFLKWSYSYWKRIGLESPEPEFIYGNIKGFLTKKMSIGDQFKIIYDELKSRGLKHGGCYASFSPNYLPIDLDLIKSVLQKDFNHFVNRGIYYNEKIDPLTGHLLTLEDEKWKNLRGKLTPTFSSGKMKMMFQTLVSCTPGLDDLLKDHSNMQDAVDIKDIVSRFTTDIIASVAFGLDCNCLKNPDAEFRKFGLKIIDEISVNSIKGLMSMLLPKFMLDLWGFKILSPEVDSFLLNVVKDTVQYRERNKIHRKDFMHLLLQLKNRGEIADDEIIDEKVHQSKNSDLTLTVTQMAAQCFVFFLAGFETSATTMTFALVELALHQDIQDKLREEIQTVLEKNDGQVTYDAIMSMSYLDKVIHETLRLHPPVPVVPRICTKAYKVPDTNVVIEVGTRMQIPIQGIHWDPEYYPEPEKFDPERFNEENKAKRHAFAFMPFGEGPRICIGARFGLLQVKVGLSTIIKNYTVTLNDKMKMPMRHSPDSSISSVEGGVWLNVARND